jgi:hypothetical protein
MAEAPLIDLILRGRIASRPVTLVGRLKDGTLAEVSGCVTLHDETLSTVLADLKTDDKNRYGEAADVLQQLVGSGDIVLEKLGIAYCSDKSKTSRFVQVGLIIKVGDISCQFALLKGMGDNGGFIVGADLSSAQKPGLKTFLSGLIGDISIGNLGIYYASKVFNHVALFGSAAFQDAKQLPQEPPQITDRPFPQGVQVSAEILVGGVNLLDQLLDQLANNRTEPTAPEEPKTPPAPDETGKAKETLSKDSTYWLEAKKTLGPLSIRRIGLSYEAQRKNVEPSIGIKFDAGLQLSFLTLSLEGMGLSYPINKFSTNPQEIWENLKFHLDGAAVAFSGGPLTIGGGLIKVEDPAHPDRLQLDGFLLIRTEIFTITALGSYADMNGTPSLFVFAALQKELGGPSFFFVTGLAVGFGINRALKLPVIEEVQNFPLLKAATDPDYLGKDLDLTGISRRLGEYIYPQKGDFWFAAGVKFNSFGLIDSFALLSVSFGTQLEIALLGMSKIRVPKQLPGTSEDQVPAIACAELAFKVAFSPASGVLSAEAQLTDNSFLFVKDCQLRGGFAFYCWFARDHAGDFVVTLGGYHAQFDKPPHYPVVPRLRIHWPVSAELSITGEAYFALTPACLMAGGKLDAVFQAGPLRAWFYARADFLIAWKPFYYDIEVGVRIGVALQTDLLTLTIELAASVHMWGPPFGGIAHVTWFIISFDIPFGKQEPDEPEELTWEEFHQSFLPQSQPGEDPVLSIIRITRGLLSEREVGTGDAKRTLRVVNAHELRFTTESVIPSTKVSLNDQPTDETPREAELGIRPMRKATLQSTHAVRLQRKDGSSLNQWEQKHLDFQPVTKNVPYALWSNDLSRLKTPSADMIKNVTSGLQVLLKARDPIHALEPIDLEEFKYDKYEKTIPWIEITVPGEIAAPGERTLMNTIQNQISVTQKRNAILSALGKKADIESIDLSDLAVNARRTFQAMPAMARLGEPLKPPASS